MKYFFCASSILKAPLIIEFLSQNILSVDFQSCLVLNRRLVVRFTSKTALERKKVCEWNPHDAHTQVEKFIFVLHEWKNAILDFPIDQHCFNPSRSFHVSQFPLSLAIYCRIIIKKYFWFIVAKSRRHNKSNSPPILLSTLAEALMTLLFFFIKIFRALSSHLARIMNFYGVNFMAI